MKQWAFFMTLGGNHWSHPILTTIHEAEDNEAFPAVPDNIRKYFGDIYYRLNMLPRIIKRINNGWDKLQEQLNRLESQHIFSDSTEGYAFPLDDDNLRYHLMIDIDSLLFEINTCCELVKLLIFKLYNHIGITIREDKAGIELAKILKNAGQDITWFSILDEHRNLFIHEATPRLCVEIIDYESKKFELVIMKENCRTFGDKSKYIRLSELASIVDGFYRSLPHIQEKLISVVRSRMPSNFA